MSQTVVFDIILTDESKIKTKEIIMSLKTLKIKRAIHKVARENNKSVRKSVRTNRQELKKIIDHLK